MIDDEAAAMIGALGTIERACNVIVARVIKRYDLPPFRAEGLVHAAMAEVMGNRIGRLLDDPDRLQRGGLPLDDLIARLTDIIRGQAEMTRKQQQK